MLGRRVTQEEHNVIICLCSWFMYIIGTMTIEDLMHNYEFGKLLNTICFLSYCLLALGVAKAAWSYISLIFPIKSGATNDKS